MSQPLIIALVHNSLLLLAMVFLYSAIVFKHFDFSSVSNRLLTGVVLGILGIVLMLDSWTLSEGVVFDARSVLLSVAGLYFGLLPTATAMTTTGLYRLYAGGAGAGVGILVILSSGFMGLAWRRVRKNRPGGGSFVELFLFGVLVHAVVLLCLSLLPPALIPAVMVKVAPFFLGLLPLVTAVLGKMLAAQEQHRDAQETLRKTEALMNETQQIAKIGGWDYRPDTGKMFWTDEVYRIYGVSKETYDPGDISTNIGFYHSEDRSLVGGAFAKAVAKGVGYDLTLRFRCANGKDRWVRTTGNAQKRDGIVSRVYGHIMDITRPMEAEKALRESEERFRRALDNIPAVVAIYDRDLIIQYINRSVQSLAGRPVADFIGKRETEIWPASVYAPYMPTLKKALETGTIRFLETVLTIPDVGERFIKMILVPLKDAGGRVREVLCITNDVTAEKLAEISRKNLEEQFRQAQKMEAVGRLAGGVAHDFNNLLSIILGYAELLLDDVAAAHPHHGQLQEIYDASLRAKNITRQLLAFGRKQVLEIRTFDVNSVLDDLQKLLIRMIGEDIDVVVALADGPCMVKADVSQFEQAIMNLAVNAKDAMLDGGTLIIRTEVADLDEQTVAGKMEVAPGPYVRVSVTDSGTGITPEQLEYIFEPFYTTKALDKGTGLGLAMVYGIVKQHGGGINVYSEPGHGTTFSLYFPHAGGAEVSAAVNGDRPIDAGPVAATILVVEDDAMVRKLAGQIVADRGYRVLMAETARDAVQTVRSCGGGIDLLLTDVIMPSMNGPEVYEKIKAVAPGAKVLYMSGYPGDVITRHGVLEKNLQFIQKPFTKKALLEKIAILLAD